MVQYIILVLTVMLLIYVVKLVKLLEKFNESLENFNVNMLEEFNQVKVDISNSTAKLQDCICEVHESIENCHKEMVDLTKKSFEGQVEHMKLVEKLNTSNTREIVSTAMKDASAHRQDIYNTAKDAYNKINTHDNYTVAHNKEVRQVLSELLSAIQALSVTKSDNLSADVPNDVEKPKKAIRRNRRKYTKDTEEVKN
jgi:hypothetical protein